MDGKGWCSEAWVDWVDQLSLGSKQAWRCLLGFSLLELTLQHTCLCLALSKGLVSEFWYASKHYIPSHHKGQPYHDMLTRQSHEASCKFKVLMAEVPFWVIHVGHLPVTQQKWWWLLGKHLPAYENKKLFGFDFMFLDLVSLWPLPTYHIWQFRRISCSACWARKSTDLNFGEIIFLSC